MFSFSSAKLAVLEVDWNSDILNQSCILVQQGNHTVPRHVQRTCFDLYFDRFDGFIFETEKPFENVCAGFATSGTRNDAVRKIDKLGSGVCLLRGEHIRQVFQTMVRSTVAVRLRSIVLVTTHTVKRECGGH